MPTWRILRPTTRSPPTASTSPTRRWGPASRPSSGRRIGRGTSTSSGMTSSKRLVPPGDRVLHPRDHTRPTRYRVVEPARRASRSGDQSGGSAGRAGCRRCGSRGLVRYLQLGRRQRAARGDGPGAGAFARVDRSSARTTSDTRLPLGGQARVSRGRGCDARRCGAPPDMAPPTSSTRPRSATPLPTEFGDMASRQSRNACTPDVAKQMAANWYEIDVRAVLPAVKMSDAPADQGWPRRPGSQLPRLTDAERGDPTDPPGAWSDGPSDEPGERDPRLHGDRAATARAGLGAGGRPVHGHRGIHGEAGSARRCRLEGAPRAASRGGPA